MLDVNINNKVAYVTLDRPEKHNAFDDELIKMLTKEFEAIDQSNDIRALVLSGNGKSFSAGADLGWMKRMASYSYEENLEDAKCLAAMLSTLNKLSKPSIARVQGAAFGGAVGLVSCCDIAIATPKASFSLSEVKIGLTPATISPYVMAAMGSRAARRYFLTGERFFADKALALGLVHEVVDENQLDDTVDKMARQLLANSPQAVSQAKALVLDFSGRQIDEELKLESSERIAKIRVSHEGQEGLSAFLEKRNPAWLKGEADV